MPIPADIAIGILAVVVVLPLYAALDRIAGRLCALERRFEDSAPQIEPATASKVERWRQHLAALETDGADMSPRGRSLRRRLERMEDGRGEVE